ncbi:hypothetical protein [Salinicola aestuarinus]|uniref:hypothetical protein n=1 Tax=Salinicola aestuarinus TaxID=1949082 RepID=UPI000DA1ECF4|nr:hypothetical protein [Salinicola aestuarinus]
MIKSRPFLLQVVLPLAAMVIVGAVIFGKQVLSPSQVDQEIQQAIASELDTSSSVELSQLQKVQYDYGVCGQYQLAGSDTDHAPFFYDTVNDRLTLDVDASAYTANCERAAGHSGHSGH